MLPCCILGGVLVVQIMAISRWIRRVILKRPVEADAEVKLSDVAFFLRRRGRMAGWGPRKKWFVLGSLFASQIAFVVAFFALDGVRHVKMILNALR